MADRQGKKSGGAKKYGRSKIKCSIYRSLNKREKNKVRRFKKMLKRTKQLELLEKIKNFNIWDSIKARIRK